MQLTKKSVLWAESGVVTKPNDVKIEEGWTGTPAEQPPAEWFNWILYSDEGNINDLIDANNVLDTELSNAITDAGLVPDLTPSGPGNQLSEAIFSSEAIGTAALSDGSVTDDKLGDDLDLGHFIGGDLTLVTGDEEFILEYYNSTNYRVKFRHNVGTTEEYSILDFDNLVFEVDGQETYTRLGRLTGLSTHYDDGGSLSRDAKIQATDSYFRTEDIAGNMKISMGGGVGLQYQGTADPGTDQGVKHRIMVSDLYYGVGLSPSALITITEYLTSDVYYFGPGSVDAHGHVIGRSIVSGGTPSQFTNPGIPITCRIFGIWLEFTNTSGERAIAPIECNLEPSDDDPTVWGVQRLNVFMGPSQAIDTAEDMKVIVHYDASSIL